MKRDFAIVTNLLQAESFPVLKDWLDFLPYPPRTLHVYCGYNEETKALLWELCDDTGIKLVIAPDTLTEDIRKSDIPVITWQFRSVEEPYCLRISLDTIPYRKSDDDWLGAALSTLERDGLEFVTGSTRPFRQDSPLPGGEGLLTQRVSFNFIIIDPRKWLDLAERRSELREVYRRFFTEGLLEHHCRETGTHGLRLENRDDWRVFHVQIWDAKINAAREALRSERKVAGFLKGYEDDQRHPWERYFMYPKPPLAKRLRMHLGKMRHQILSR